MATEVGTSKASRRLGIPLQTLHNWEKKSKAGRLVGTSDYNPDLASINDITYIWTNEGWLEH